MVISKHFLGDLVKEVRSGFKQINYDDLLVIIAAEAGTGKSTATIDYSFEHAFEKKDEKILIITNNYNLFESTYAELLNQPDVVLFQGMNKKCLKKDENIQRIKAKRAIPGISPGDICKYVCIEDERNRCPYYTQNTEVIDARIVFTVPMLMGTVCEMFKPNRIFIDENTTYSRDYSFIEKDIDYKLEKLVKEYIEIRSDDYVHEIDFIKDDFPEIVQKDPETLEVLRESDFFSAKGMRNKWLYEDHFRSYIDWNFYESVFKLVFDNCMNHFDEKGNLLKEIYDIRPEILFGYLKRSDKYGISPKMLSDPFEYQIFDKAFIDEINVVMLDASFNEKRFIELFKLWKFEKSQSDWFLEYSDENTEIYHKKEYNVHYYYSSIKSNQEMNRVQKKSNWYSPCDLKEIFLDSTNYNYYYSNIKNTINQIPKTGDTVGVITNKTTERMLFEDNPEIMTGHYNGIRGLNNLQNVDHLFVFETPKNPLNSKFYNSEKNGYGFAKDANGNKQIGLTERFIAIFKRIPDCYNANEIGTPMRGDTKYYSPYEPLLNEKTGKMVKNPIGNFLCRADINKHAIEKNRDGWTFDMELRFQVHGEIYQAAHRARPLLSDSTQIWLFCPVPEKLEEEFEINNWTFTEFQNHFAEKKITARAFREQIRSEINSLKLSNPELTKDAILSKIAEKRGFMTKKSRQMQPNAAFLKVLLSIDDFDIEKLDGPEKHKVIADFPGIRLEGRYSFEKFLKDFDQYFSGI